MPGAPAAFRYVGGRVGYHHIRYVPRSGELRYVEHGKIRAFRRGRHGAREIVRVYRAVLAERKIIKVEYPRAVFEAHKHAVLYLYQPPDKSVGYYVNGYPILPGLVKTAAAGVPERDEGRIIYDVYRGIGCALADRPCRVGHGHARYVPRRSVLRQVLYHKAAPLLLRLLYGAGRAPLPAAVPDA